MPRVSAQVEINGEAYEAEGRLAWESDVWPGRAERVVEDIRIFKPWGGGEVSQEFYDSLSDQVWEEISEELLR